MDSTLQDGDTAANRESSNEVVQPNSFDQQKFKEELLNSVKELISDPRTTQSIKDKTMAEIKKDKGFKEFLNEYRSMKEAGMTDKEIELEARLKEVEATRSVTHDTPGRAVAGDTTDAVKMFAKVLGLDLNDPEVVTSFKGDTEATLKELKTIADRRKVAANPAVVTQPSGDGARQPDLAEYQSRAKNLRGTDLINLKMEYRKRGLDIN